MAHVLNEGFQTKLTQRAELADSQHRDALDHHYTLVEDARTSHHSDVAAQQAALDRDSDAVRSRTANLVASRKSDWLAKGRAISTGARAELTAERSAAVNDVAQSAGHANAEGGRLVAEATSQAQTAGQDGKPGVQRSLWGWVERTASGLVDSARDGLATLGAAARGLVDAALSKARALFEAARAAISERVARFAATARRLAEQVRDSLGAAARAAISSIRSAVAAGRAALDRIIEQAAAIGRRLVDRLVSAIRSAGAWLIAKGKAIVQGFVAAVRAIVSLAGKVRLFIAVTTSKVLRAAGRIIDDPRGFVAPYQARVGEMIAQVPGAAVQMYDRHVAPLAGVGPAAASKGAAPVVQRQATTVVDAPAHQPTHGAIVKEYLKERLAYLGQHWGSVILDALFEIFVPFVTFYRHLPPLLKACWQAIQDLMRGNVSDAIDNGLKAARELMAIVGTLFAQFAIVAFIAGSVLGTPIVGEAAMFAIGMGILGLDAVVQGASIWAAWANLNHAGRPREALNEDYSVIADAILSLGITLALILIAAVGQKLGKVLLARFPRVAGALDAILERLRKAVRGEKPVVDVPAAPAVAPPATEFPGRAGLTPSEQAAFDRFIADRRAAPGGLSPEFEAKLKAATPDQLRAMARRAIAGQADVEDKQARAAQAEATNASDRLDPAMSNVRDEGGNVRSRWNEVEPSPGEIAQAKAVAATTGEPVELFGDGYRGIDGTVGGRPLQLKGVPAGSPPLRGPAGVYRSAVIARDKAIANGFSNVEVYIDASGISSADIAAEFARPSAPGTYLDGVGSRKVIIRCSGGDVFEPPTQAAPFVPPPPAHIDGQDDENAKVPAGIGG